MNSIENEAKKIFSDDAAPKPEKVKGKARPNKKLYFYIGVPALLFLFYNVESIYWFNQDVKELAGVYAGAIQIERECKRRDDLLPNLINITMEYAKHERGLFQYVSDIRARLAPAAATHGSNPTVNSGELLAKLIALSEQYPDLKAAQSFQDLMDMLETTEDRIATMRDNYVYAVYKYNLCNQRFWCPFFTYIVNFICPMPTFVHYFYFKSRFTGEWSKLQAPVMIQEALSEKEKRELMQPTPFSVDSMTGTAKGGLAPLHEEGSK